MITEPDSIFIPSQSPLFHANNAGRYDRQRLIVAYEQASICRLVVVIDVLLDHSLTLLEEVIYDADPKEDLHLLFSSPGGDGETAVRMVRSVQARYRELTVIIPDQAKSAATLFTLGAHQILMGPSSDLGPIDPQMWDGQNLRSAKDIIAAVDDAAKQIQSAPETFPLYASLLSDVSAIQVQQARAALGQTHELLREALRSNPSRNESEIKELTKELAEPLISRPQTHTALFSATDAEAAGLPIKHAVLQSNQWELLWRLWTKYLALGQNKVIYEGRRASQVSDYPSIL